MPKDRSTFGDRYETEMAAGKKKRKPHQIYNSVLAQVNFLRSIESYYPKLDLSGPGVHESPEIPQVCHFTKVPPEIRLAIYEHALSRNISLTLYRRVQHTRRGPALLLVSKQVRTEALPIYYKKNSFTVSVHMVQFEQLSLWMERLANVCGKRASRKFSFDVLAPQWKYITAVWPLLNLLSRGTLSLSLRDIDLETEPPNPGSAKPESLFRMKKHGNEYLQRALEEAVVLARWAKKEEWGPRKLKDEFDALIAGYQTERLLIYRGRKYASIREHARMLQSGNSSNKEMSSTDQGS